MVVKRLADLGERAAIRRIERILSKGKHQSGIGDDCATIAMGTNYLLVTTDMIFQRTHIPPEMTPYQMGWFLVAINLSDIAAKGGIPLGLVLSYGLPKHTSETFLKRLTKGANTCAVAYHTTIVGGDTKETAEVTLCGTAFGTVEKPLFMSRTGAYPGDVIAVTGTLGQAGAGYHALKLKLPGKTLTKAFLEPQPRLKEGRLLARHRVVTSSMDLSDGLSASLYQLREANTVGFEINKDALPIASELRTVIGLKPGIDPYSVALHFGGDYELLVTLPKTRFEAVQQAFKGQRTSLTPIGVVTRNKDILLVDGTKKRVLPNKGYEHFTSHRF